MCWNPVGRKTDGSKAKEHLHRWGFKSLICLWVTVTKWTLEQKVQFSENQSTSKMSNAVIHKTLKTVIILNSHLKKKKKKTISENSRSRLLIRASGKMCKRTIQSKFLASVKGNIGEQREEVLKLQKTLEPFPFWAV